MFDVWALSVCLSMCLSVCSSVCVYVCVSCNTRLSGRPRGGPLLGLVHHDAALVRPHHPFVVQRDKRLRDHRDVRSLRFAARDAGRGPIPEPARQERGARQRARHQMSFFECASGRIFTRAAPCARVRTGRVAVRNVASNTVGRLRRGCSGHPRGPVAGDASTRWCVNGRRGRTRQGDPQLAMFEKFPAHSQCC